MGDYHFVYKDVEGASTQWDDIQRKLGNLPEKPPAFKPPPFTPASDQDSIPKDKSFIDSKTEKELEFLEDDLDLDDDRFLQEYRKKRLTEMREATKIVRFGSVVPISGSDFVREVSQAGPDVWVVVLLYKDGYAECGVLMKCLEELAVKYPGTKFVKIVSTDCIPNYPDHNLPTLLVYNNGAVKANYAGLRSFGRRCTPEGVALVLCQSDPVLNDGQGGTDRSRDSVIEGVRRKLIEKVVKEHEVENEKGKSEDDEGQVGSCGNNNKIGPADFEILRVVGKGAFGKVFQVRKKTGDGKEKEGGGGSGDGIYAMKVMRKDTIIKKKHVDYMKAERDILTKVVHPFIVQLRYSFQTKSKLYLILDFMNGGHLFFHLYRQGIFSEDQARFYTAEIVSAVAHLHKCGIVHRDLKPENILLDADGHVLLTDFGLAKEIDESSRSNSMCGTTEYMAPEILLSKGHNKDADWWSVGILLYEMLTGQPPFTHSNRKKLQERIIKERVKLPPYLSSEAHSLLKGLLQKEPSRRLGSGLDGGDEIKGHKWLRPINWKKLEARELQPKYIPDVSGKDCTANFDQCWTTMPLDDSPAPTPTAGEHFQGYTYVAPNPWLSSG